MRTLAKSGHRGAKLAKALLARTDSLLSVILLGNNLVNAAAASLVTIIAFVCSARARWRLTLATLTATFLILVFSEVTPKVIGATYSGQIASVVSYALTLMLKVFGPLVWFINLFVQGLLRLMHLAPSGHGGGSMGAEELRTVLAESGTFLPSQHRSMLLNLFDLEN
jgi:Mg2+/Co2+ transporter CorB